MRRIFARFRFASGGHHDHHHEVRLNQHQTWVSVANRQLLGIQGFNDNHFHPHESHENPYQHLVDAPFFSFERFYFNEPYYHSDESDPLSNTPHGYLITDDPLSERNNIEVPVLEISFVVTLGIIVALVIGQTGLNSYSKGEMLLNGHITRGLIEDELRKIRQQNNDLITRRDELKQLLSQK